MEFDPNGAYIYHEGANVCAESTGKLDGIGSINNYPLSSALSFSIKNMNGALQISRSYVDEDERLHI